MTTKTISLSLLLFCNLASLGANESSIDIPQTLLTGNSIVPNDDTYYKYKLKDRDIEVIYTKENIPFAKHTVEMEKKLHKDYENFFGWKLDETLYVGLISKQNQIANGFSTQSPNNRQINYIGGTSQVDYFSNTSWLDVLIYHETTHNYQLNVKGSIVSQTLHSIVGNGSFIFPMPYIVVPNMTENSFMLEGNAVLNESWHGTGGRLYNGRFKAMTILQAKAGNITPQNMYNAKLGFPYAGDIYYNIGGFYNLFLAQKYGTKTVDKYFYNKSKDWWFPHYTNNAMKKTVGSDFETTLKDFANYYKKLATNFVIADGKKIASSQFYTPLSNNKDEIFFLTNEKGYREPELIVINKANEKITKDRGSWLSGKVLKTDGNYYIQGSHNTSPTKITEGLFDKNAFIKEDSASKVIQGYLSDKTAVYFDVAKSYDYPQLYVGDKYYAYTNSSVFIDNNDNIYYFANENKGKKRTLYKNKKPLFTYEGFYGIIADVDTQGAIYFIANSKLGSSLYRYKDAKVTRASKADNILEARLINDNEIILSAVSDSDFYYVKNNLQTIDEKPYNTKLFFEDKEYFKPYTSMKRKPIVEDLNDKNTYSSFLDMHYSGADFALAKATNGAITGNLNLKFSDPLATNSLNLFALRDDTNTSVAGMGYENTQYLLQYSLSAYYVLKTKQSDTRSNGIIASAKLPLYKNGYYNANLGLSYYQDYSTLERKPLTASLSLSRIEHFGISMYNNCSNTLEMYGVSERKDNIAGAAYRYTHDLGYEFYFDLAGHYSISNAKVNDSIAKKDTRGVKVASSASLDMDLSSIIMPTIDNTQYIKSIGFGEIGLSKVLNFSSYWFTFPVSLQREAIYTKYRYYKVKSFNQKEENVKEFMAGIRFDIVQFNSNVLPFSLEFYHNGNTHLTKNKDQVKFSFGSSF